MTKRNAADAGNNDMNEMRQAMDAIKNSSNDIAKIIKTIAEIATASHEQNHGISQINTAVSQMDKITQANAAASEELSAQSVTLKQAVGQLQALVGGASRSHHTASLIHAKPQALKKHSVAKMDVIGRPRRDPVQGLTLAAAKHTDDLFKDV